MPFWALKLLGNKYAVLAIGLFFGLSAALTWHYIDKAAAVRSAKQELADKVLIETQRSQLEELERRAKIAEQQRIELEKQVAVAEAGAVQMAQELEEYENSTQVNAACVVDSSILDRLRNR